MSSRYSGDSPLLRNLSVSTAASRRSRRDADLPPPPADSNSDFECGLAYADSTDDESAFDRNPELSPVLRAASATRNSSGRAYVLSSGEKKRPSHSRNDSRSSSYSSTSGSSKSRSSGIAQALGITQSPPSKLGGPYRQRSDSDSSSDSRSTYSRVTSMGNMAGPIGRGLLGQTMETLLEDVAMGESPEETPETRTSTGQQRSVGGGKYLNGGCQDKGIGFVTMSTGGQPQRSNTVQVPPHSPENKPPKLPARAKTTNDRDKLLEPLAARKEKVRKPRICLRCEKKIEDGRWVKVDTGGALCERCWKNMYLPKVRS